MGLEQLCTLRFGDQRSEGKALLEADSLQFRGGFRLQLMLAELTDVRVEGAELVVTSPEGTARLDLGPAAARWAERIRNPRSRLDKIGLRPGAHVAVLNLADPTFLQELRNRAGALSEDTPRTAVDAIFVGVEQRSELQRLRLLRWYLRRDGALWVIRPKGSKVLTEAQVRDALRGLGFVDVKVVAFSDTHTAEKFVLPVASR
ncbi:MAG: DUF3052 domain-containing protein [Deltaproteobacteria bacterium]|nr:DUF3052 domain-containing protein [Deltaproteobacteria bacterium]